MNGAFPKAMNMLLPASHFSEMSYQDLLWFMSIKPDPTPLESALAQALEDLLLEQGWDADPDKALTYCGKREDQPWR